jgi:hypothetical protein
VASTDAARAYYLALSGLNFWSVGKTGTYTLGDGAFSLSQSGPDAQGYYTVTSIGSCRAGTAAPANCRLSAKKKNAKPITFDDDIDDFILPVLDKTTNSAQSIVVFDKDMPDAQDGWSVKDWASLWAANVNRYSGGWMRLGGNTTNTTGAIWYGGDYGSCTTSVCPDGTCKDGACSLGPGLRAYFRFVFLGYDNSSNSTACADGFTFAVITAANDPATAAGGPAEGSMGELLGYGGPGPSGCGIAPPKLAVEVDSYPNKGKGKPTAVNNRNDASDANHVAVLYWGDASTTYDDNVHGAGNNPGNPASNSKGYLQRTKTETAPNWLEDGEPHALRLELHRAGETSGGGTYRVKVWIDPAGTGKNDVTADYDAEPPQLDHTATLSAADHAKLNVVRFGWTEGTGSKAQTVAIYDFSLDFRH